MIFIIVLTVNIIMIIVTMMIIIILKTINNFTGVSGMDLAGDSFVVRVGVVRVGVALGEGVNLGGEARGVVGLGVLVLLILPRYNSSVL